MPRPGGGPGNYEKARDFKGSMIRLLKNLSPWKYIMIVALGLAMTSAILALVAPNRLSKFADFISEGLVPRTEVLEEIGKEISNKLTGDKLGNKIALIHTSSSINPKDLKDSQVIFQKLGTVKTPEEGMELLLELPDSVLMYLMEEIEVEGTIITVEDQV